MRYAFHTVWNSSKIISQPNSLRPAYAPSYANMGDLLQREHPQIRVELGWVQIEHIKRAVAPKRCKIGPRLLLRTNMKSHTRFRLHAKFIDLG